MWATALCNTGLARSRVLRTAMCAPDASSSSSSSMPLSSAIAALHTAKRAAADQQGRLRKTADGAHAQPAEAGEPAAATSAMPAVHLVGVGPGDVELLTVKALRLMQSADLVLYDRLIAPEILELVSEDAAMLYVGKEAGLHTRPQEEIHQLLLSFATAGRTVVRLKGGDPLVFGRGGEELEYLEQQGVPVRIVPGVTAASGVAASLGVPLTHRDHADGVRFVTGHARSENTTPVEERYQWAQLADEKTTLVVYMGLSTLPELTSGLLAAGMPADMPAVAVQDGTTPTQRVVTSALGALADDVAEEGLRSPTLVVIGHVVSLLTERGGAPGEVAAIDVEQLARKQGTPVMDADQVLEVLRRARQLPS